jgi:hypothetical protein
MTKTWKLAMVLLLSAAGVAQAGGSEGSIGVGGEVMLGGLPGPAGGPVGGASLNYDAGKFHVGGFVGLNDPAGPNNTDFTMGGRFFYHVASTSGSDFGLGGTLGIFSDGNPNGMGTTNRNTYLFLEPGFQIRAFIVPNVALSFTGGIVIGALDAGGVAFGAQVQGLAGIHYYFFGSGK